MPTNRANSTNSIGIGTTQTQTNVAASVGAQVYVTTFPRPSGLTVTVKSLNGAMVANGCAVNDVVERDSDGGFWDAAATTPCNVPPEFTSLATGNDMISS
jgi:hypothetical protein